jgi:hypothetical protein
VRRLRTINKLNILHSVVLLLLSALICGTAYCADWGSAVIDTDGLGNPRVIMENSKIRIRWGNFFESHAQFSILDFVVKEAGNQDQDDKYLDACADRGELANAAILQDDANQITVRLQWHKSNQTTGINMRHDYTIYPNSEVVRVDYLLYGINQVDIGSPGGISSGTYRFHGGDLWERLGSPVGYPIYPCVYYDRYSGDMNNSELCLPPNYLDPADAGSLNYNGHFVGIVYDPANGTGFGRIMPVADCAIIKLLWGRGFETFCHAWFEPHTAFTGFIFAVTGGQTQGLQLGHAIVDNGGPPPIPTPDLNGDHWVDFRDFAELAMHWLGYDPTVDIIRDGIIDANDLIQIADYWMSGF